MMRQIRSETAAPGTGPNHTQQRIGLLGSQIAVLAPLTRRPRALSYQSTSYLGCRCSATQWQGQWANSEPRTTKETTQGSPMEQRIEMPILPPCLHLSTYALYRQCRPTRTESQSSIACHTKRVDSPPFP